MRRTILLILVLTLAVAGEASASGTDVLRDCTDDGRLQKTYTQKELKAAIAQIPSDVDEYTDCRDVIKEAQLAGASSGPTDPGGDTGATGTGTGTGTSTGTGTTGGGLDAGSAGAGGSGDDGGADAGTGTGAGTSSGEKDDNPPTGRAGGSFGGFSGFEEDPLEAASEAERVAVAEAVATRPAPGDRVSGPGASVDLPTPLWIVIALAAVALIALAATDLRRRVVARRVV